MGSTPLSSTLTPFKRLTKREKKRKFLQGISSLLQAGGQDTRTFLGLKNLESHLMIFSAFRIVLVKLCSLGPATFLWSAQAFCTTWVLILQLWFVQFFCVDLIDKWRTRLAITWRAKECDSSRSASQRCWKKQMMERLRSLPSIMMVPLMRTTSIPWYLLLVAMLRHLKLESTKPVSSSILRMGKSYMTIPRRLTLTTYMPLVTSSMENLS